MDIEIHYKDAYESQDEVLPMSSPIRHGSITGTGNNSFADPFSIPPSSSILSSLPPGVNYDGDRGDLPALRTAYLTKTLHPLLAFLSKKKYYFVLEKGSLSYYEEGPGPDMSVTTGQRVKGKIASLKWKTVSCSGRSVAIRGTMGRIKIDLRFEDVATRDDWYDALLKHIAYAKMMG
jgi:hypothetical protein